MRIPGEWLEFSDGAKRPVIEPKVLAAGGEFVGEHFLVDTCADCSALSADLLRKLNLQGSAPSTGISLKGISGDSPFVVVTTVMVFLRDDGGVVRISGQFAAFTEPTATDLSILGRDVLDHFDVIVSRRRSEVLLLAGNHRYQVV